jgi:plasmid stabilization system protein ParE
VTTTIIIQPEAEGDLSEAFKWYEGRHVGLGNEFLEQAGVAFERIAEAPLRPRSRHRGTRRVWLRRFPYVVLYLAHDDRVFILAVLHERRSPRLFRSRAAGFDLS